MLLGFGHGHKAQADDDYCGALRSGEEIRAINNQRGSKAEDGGFGSGHFLNNSLTECSVMGVVPPRRRYSSRKAMIVRRVIPKIVPSHIIVAIAASQFTSNSFP